MSCETEIIQLSIVLHNVEPNIINESQQYETLTIILVSIVILKISHKQ